MIGFLFVAAVIVVVAIVGFRMVPSYVEYYTVQSAVSKALRDAPRPDAGGGQQSFEKYIAADYIDSVTASDLESPRKATSSPRRCAGRSSCTWSAT